MNRHRLATLAGVGVLIVAIQGCYQTPLQRLHGRWYNADMSLRFQPDGTVLFNSAAGLARGRYVLSEESVTADQDVSSQLLRLDVVRQGVRERLLFHVTFLAEDRLKLRVADAPPTSTRTTESVRQFALLRRAVETETNRQAVTGRNRRSSST